jgi:hypothetical protein
VQFIVASLAGLGCCKLPTIVCLLFLIAYFAWYSSELVVFAFVTPWMHRCDLVFVTPWWTSKAFTGKGSSGRFGATVGFEFAVAVVVAGAVVVAASVGFAVRTSRGSFGDVVMRRLLAGVGDLATTVQRPGTQVLAPSQWRTHPLEPGARPLVDALNAVPGVKTWASCHGHWIKRAMPYVSFYAPQDFAFRLTLKLAEWQRWLVGAWSLTVTFDLEGSMSFCFRRHQDVSFGDWKLTRWALNYDLRTLADMIRGVAATTDFAPSRGLLSWQIPGVPVDAFDKLLAAMNAVPGVHSRMACATDGLDDGWPLSNSPCVVFTAPIAYASALGCAVCEVCNSPIRRLRAYWTVEGAFTGDGNLLYGLYGLDRAMQLFGVTAVDAVSDADCLASLAVTVGEVWQADLPKVGAQARECEEPHDVL